MATSALPSQGRHIAEKSIWLNLLYVLGLPIGGTNQNGYITLAFLGSP